MTSATPVVSRLSAAASLNCSATSLPSRHLSGMLTGGSLPAAEAPVLLPRLDCPVQLARPEHLKQLRHGHVRRPKPTTYVRSLQMLQCAGPDFVEHDVSAAVCNEQVNHRPPVQCRVLHKRGLSSAALDHHQPFRLAEMGGQHRVFTIEQCHQCNYAHANFSMWTILSGPLRCRIHLDVVNI